MQKVYGFIQEDKTGSEFFVHVKDLKGPIKDDEVIAILQL